MKFSLVFKHIHPLLHTRGVGMDGTHPHTHIHKSEKETGFIFWECLLIVLFIHSLCPRQSFGGAERSDLPDYNWINSRPCKIIMEIWKWYTSNEVNQLGFSVYAAKSHSGPTRWQHLESKANTALVLIKGPLLTLTGFNEKLEVKDKQTNSDFASCSHPALVPISVLIKEPRSEQRELSSLPLRTATSPRLVFFFFFLLAVFSLFFQFFSQCFLCLTGQPISGGSQNSREFVFLVIKVLCWVISSEAGPQYKGWAAHEDTYMHTPNKRGRTSTAFCPRPRSTDD